MRSRTRRLFRSIYAPTAERDILLNLDALRLIASPEDGYFRCESCNGELVAESDNLAAARDMGDGPKDMLRKLEEQLEPLTDQLGRVPVPEFRNLHAWEIRRANAGRVSARGFGGTLPMPFVGETKVEVAFCGVDDQRGEDTYGICYESSTSLDDQASKSKRDDNEGDHEDIEWEEAAPSTGESYKANDLNVEAGASGDDEDDIDWEEG
ncbi:hypothetical protein RHGRI_013817 [Rhododendron griersonianum]|uniref:Uncharacterized protein n=1 Tax=Rhododendron griersonianum TaxID=479676 RepID=A0AAV6K797_9ERIC|nr:hypothetical protein RHGRI_013817 [Rhododendron griersonianum]